MPKGMVGASLLRIARTALLWRGAPLFRIGGPCSPLTFHRISTPGRYSFRGLPASTAGAISTSHGKSSPRVQLSGSSPKRTETSALARGRLAGRLRSKGQPLKKPTAREIKEKLKRKRERAEQRLLEASLLCCPFCNSFPMAHGFQARLRIISSNGITLEQEGVPFYKCNKCGFERSYGLQDETL